MSKDRFIKSTSPSASSNAHRGILMLFLLNIGISLSMESVNALFPLYVQSIGASILEVGLLLSAAGLFSTAIMLPSGWASDRFGRRKTLVLSVLIGSFPPLLYTLATDWRQIIPWAMIFSASFAVFIPARMVYIADSTASGDRAKMYGYMNLAWPIGSVVGPMAAGILAKAGGFHYPFYFAVAVSLLSFVPAFLLLESPKAKHSSSASDDLSSKGAAGFSRQVIYLLAILTVYQLLVSAGIGTTYSLLSIYLTDVFKVDKLYVGLFLSLVGGTLFASQIVGGWAGSRFGLKKTIEVCLAVIPLLFLTCTLAPSIEWFTVTYMALYSVYSITWPASVAILMGLVDRSKWGLATGIRQTGVRLGFTIGPTLGGALWEAYGARTPFYASAVLIALSIPFLLLLKEK